MPASSVIPVAAGALAASIAKAAHTTDQSALSASEIPQGN